MHEVHACSPQLTFVYRAVSQPASVIPSCHRRRKGVKKDEKQRKGVKPPLGNKKTQHRSTLRYILYRLAHDDRACVTDAGRKKKSCGRRDHDASSPRPAGRVYTPFL
ncbi:hypothetical protein BaRGS_00001593 [Batillaria attramentaria]|uniref:Uncharacterized protein n=1 Tax=Batillaria attramentaria TaxID=370345 RepID=A0ABD0M818_9CAEN